MISRICHGWTTIENTDIYENLLTTDIFPAIASKTLPPPRQAAGNVPPVTAVLRSTGRIKKRFPVRSLTPPQAARNALAIAVQKHPKVCFEFDILAESISALYPCDWDMRYQIVVGFGGASLFESAEEKRQALEIITAQYAKGSDSFTFTASKLKATAEIKVAIQTMTGRQSGLDPG